MPRHKALFTVTVVLLVACLAAGLIRIARFTPATGYPPNSSLQSGRTGTKLLFEALQQTGKLRVTRDYLPEGAAKFHNSVVLYLGVPAQALLLASDELVTKLERIAQSGNRLIIGVVPQDFQVKKKEPAPIEKRWNIRIMRHGRLTSEPAKAWQTLPDSGALQRSFGSGEILLLYNSGRLDNEMLAREGKSRALIPELIGNYRNVVFEEAHLGVVETGSIAALARRYHLEGLAAGLLIVVGLFIWNRSVPFPPPPSFEQQTGTVVAGSDAEDMLVNLLSRHIARDDLIDVCVSEWNRLRPARLLILSPEESDWVNTEDPVTAYHRIQEELHRKKTVNV